VPPLCWVANEFDRSPGELLRVASPSWGVLDGVMMNISYGMGRLYALLPESTPAGEQAGVYPLPLPAFPTGIMRGRFHPQTRELYVCGMFAWAGNRTEDGGFYRVRATGRPWHVPVALHAETGLVRVTFSEDLDPSSVASGMRLSEWSLHRSEEYGSPHVGERTVGVMSNLRDRRVVEIVAPGFGTRSCYAVKWDLKSASGSPVRGELHGTMISAWRN
jgi:hypothetical protein